MTESASDLARLRRTAKALRRLYPESKFRVSVKHHTIFQIGHMFGFPCEFSQALWAWEEVIRSAEQEPVQP